MNGFWKNWLTVWCWAVLLFGVVLALVAVPMAQSPARLVFMLLSGGPDRLALLDQPGMQFGLGLQGALTIGWALTFFALFRAAQTVGAPLWRSMTVALAVWYVVDSAISVATGFPLNAVSNTVLLVTYLAPILSSGALRDGTRTAMA